jgi:carbonic anhydrase
LLNRTSLLQLAHLRTHPAVAAGLARNTLFLQGWFYDIGTGEISVLDEQTRTTVPISGIIEKLQEQTEQETA